MMVVFDTVILVCGLLDPFGWSGRLLFDEADVIEWVASPEIVAEYRQVLQRPGLIGKYRPAANRDLPSILARIDAATIVHPTNVPKVCRDPSDDKFLAAAVSGNVAFIVSEDQDLLALGSYEQIPIVPTRALLLILGREAD
jgi:putative PIN family toxin of toxin-antitoxin system